MKTKLQRKDRKDKSTVELELKVRVKVKAPKLLFKIDEL